ncbi:ABC-type transport system substrate-binding protein [Peribacillus simplex]|nr:ABC-type transport system substrate-binding protein [Peribacillus simplex]
MKKTLALLLTTILALSLALAGCSSSTSKEKDDDKGGSNEAKGGVLIYGKGGDAVSLDPAIVTDGESFIVTQQVFETLVKYGEDNTEIKPGLAESWKVSDDAKTYTFKLKTGIKFHDGSDFNAEAVVKNFQRWAQSKDEAKFAYYASMFGGFEGDEGHVIKEVKAIDDNTVEFTLNRPQAPFLKNIAMPTFAIASPTGFEKDADNFGKNPSGTGPFKFKSWKPGDTIEVVKNDDYWQDGLPKLDGITFKVIKDNSARLNAVIKGEVDLMDGLNPSDISKVTGDDKLQIFERPSMNVGYFAFNVEKAHHSTKRKYAKPSLT